MLRAAIRCTFRVETDANGDGDEDDDEYDDDDDDDDDDVDDDTMIKLRTPLPDTRAKTSRDPQKEPSRFDRLRLPDRPACHGRAAGGQRPSKNKSREGA